MRNEITISLKKRDVIIMLIVYVIVALYLLYFSPLCGRDITHRLIQPIPFKTVIDQFRIRFGMDIFIGNVVGNVILLFPVGLFISLLGKKFTVKRGILFFMIISTSVELIQFIFAVGVLDIDDIWMNGFGGFFGYKAGKSILN